MYRRITDTCKTIMLAAVLAMATFTAQASADSAGTVHFVRFSDPSFDRFTDAPSLSMQTWLNTHIWRLGVYSPYFDDKTSWYPNGWLYRDAYAIYTGSALASEHPEWILRDGSNNKLYIPWGCSGGTCPQYAGDISNPAFRRYWIEHVSTDYARGYRGVFVDDANMDMQVGDGSEKAVAPINPSTGQPMTSAEWRAYMATFMQELRAALPAAELVHNVIWFADGHAGITDPSIRGEVSAANCIFLERGVNDSGLTGGTGQWSVNALLAYIDEIHSLGRSIVLDGTSSETQGLEYNLAAYFLVSNGGDGVSGAKQTPESWWGGWGVSLGDASGPRYGWNHLLRRDFSGGMVLVNPPEAATETVSLPAPMSNVSGNTVSSVTLPPSSGAILVSTATSNAGIASTGSSGTPLTSTGVTGAGINGTAASNTLPIGSTDPAGSTAATASSTRGATAGGCGKARKAATHPSSRPVHRPHTRRRRGAGRHRRNARHHGGKSGHRSSLRAHRRSARHHRAGRHRPLSRPCVR